MAGLLGLTHRLLPQTAAEGNRAMLPAGNGDPAGRPVPLGREREIMGIAIGGILPWESEEKKRKAWLYCPPMPDRENNSNDFLQPPEGERRSSRMMKTNALRKRREVLSAKADLLRYECRIRSVGNPDFDQYAPVSDPAYLHAATLKEMRKLIEAYREFWNLGGGNWVNPVVLRDHKPCGYFSYNGRFWRRITSEIARG